MTKRGAHWTLIDNTFYSLDECNYFCKRESEAFYDHRDSIVDICEQCLGKLLNKDCHDSLRRIYQVRRRTVPTLKREKPEGKFDTLAQSDQSTASIFCDQFLKNTQIPSDFPTDERHKDLGIRLRN
eukprot:UN18315